MIPCDSFELSIDMIDCMIYNRWVPQCTIFSILISECKREKKIKIKNKQKQRKSNLILYIYRFFATNIFATTYLCNTTNLWHERVWICVFECVGVLCMGCAVDVCYMLPIIIIWIILCIIDVLYTTYDTQYMSSFGSFDSWNMKFIIKYSTTLIRLVRWLLSFYIVHILC